MSEAPRAIVATHADLAAGLVGAVQGIAGDAAAARLIPVSNRGLDAEALGALIRQVVETSGACVIFTDLPAGSCTIAARRLARDMPSLSVVAGVNLPALLAFALGTDDARTLAATAVAKGQAGVLLAADGARGD